MTYVSNSDYTTYIFTDKKTENIEKDLQTNRLLVTHITKEDLDKFEERLIDYTFNKLKFYCRISSFYDKAYKTGFDDMRILEGDKGYGK